MYINNKLFSTLYRFLLVLLLVFIQYYSFIQPNGSFSFFSLNYFSTLIYSIAFVYYVLEVLVSGFRAINKDSKNSTEIRSLSISFKGAILVSVVFISFFSLYKGEVYAPLHDFGAFFTFFSYIVMPALIFLDWALFSKKGSFHALDPLAWVTIPFTYSVYTLIAAELGIIYHNGSKYPYIFFDVGVIGWRTTLQNIFSILLIYLIIGFILFIIDKIFYILFKILKNTTVKIPKTFPGTEATYYGAEDPVFAVPYLAGPLTVEPVPPPEFMQISSPLVPESTLADDLQILKPVSAKHPKPAEVATSNYNHAGNGFGGFPTSQNSEDSSKSSPF